jgi:hypothetical protein
VCLRLTLFLQVAFFPHVFANAISLISSSDYCRLSAWLLCLCLEHSPHVCPVCNTLKMFAPCDTLSLTLSRASTHFQRNRRNLSQSLSCHFFFPGAGGNGPCWGRAVRVDALFFCAHDALAFFMIGACASDGVLGQRAMRRKIPCARVFKNKQLRTNHKEDAHTHNVIMSNNKQHTRRAHS